MKSRLLAREVLPFVAAFVALAAAALLLDAVLHLRGDIWVGRYLGIPGISLIIASFGYSLRKRQLIEVGKPLVLLHMHERMAWSGSLLILVHADIHFTAVLAWLATLAMLINVGSGLTGKFLLQRGASGSRRPGNTSVRRACPRPRLKTACTGTLLPTRLS